MSSPHYRSDIDGLRAIAVMLVIGFHAFPDLVGGGFIGVDIFFLISGFLISSIIFSGLQEGTFRAADFYRRRIRRIFPALITVLAVGLAVGWFVLFSDEYAQMGGHISGAAAFVSNFMFWRESGYFDNAAETKQMLHLWSLSVEEQFYFFWPLVLIFIWKRRWNFMVITAGIAAASFVACSWLGFSDPNAAFYLPVARFWEIMAGGILAYLLLHNPNMGERYKHIQSVLGVFLIIIGLVVMSGKDAVSEWRILLPVSGAFFLISAGPRALFNRYVLSNRLLVGIGLISYPLYLWHWPLFSFVKAVLGYVGNGLEAALIVVAFLLAFLTYRFIECPVRYGNNRTLRSAWFLGSLMAGIFLAGIAVSTGLITSRLYPLTINDVGFQHEWTYLQPNVLRGEHSVHTLSGRGHGKTLLIGDSHVVQYSPRFEYLNGIRSLQTNTAIFLTTGGGLPLLGIFKKDPGDDKIRKKAFDLMGRKDIDTIVIGGAWNSYFKASGHVLLDNKPESLATAKGRTAALQNLKEILIKARTYRKRIFLLLDNPSGHNFSPRHFLRVFRLFGAVAGDDLSKTRYPEQQIKLDQELRSIAMEAGVEFIDPASKLCRNGYCDRIGNDGKLIFREGGHLSSDWVRSNADYIDKVFIKK